MKYKNLSEAEIEHFKSLYKDKNVSKEKAQGILSGIFNVSERTIRRWANNLGLNMLNDNTKAKVMVYDIETSRTKAWVWWTGKQYVGHHQLIDEPKVITVSWKWLGESKIHYLTWDKNHCDKKLMKKFLVHYNKADMVIGYNNDRFDNRWINARAMKYNLDVNVNVKSFDIMKEEKRVFRVPSYSMAYMSKYSNVVHKQGHEGLHMWNMIQTGTKAEQKEYLQKMVEYNMGDIAATEELYFRLRRYFKQQLHFGVMAGGEKYTCPECGGTDVSLYKTTFTAAGTMQHIMKCNVDNVQYKISRRDYLKFVADHGESF